MESKAKIMISEPVHNSKLMAFVRYVESHNGTIHGIKSVNPSDWTVDYSIPEQPELFKANLNDRNSLIRPQIHETNRQLGRESRQRSVETSQQGAL